jgi:IS30 family transposase
MAKVVIKKSPKASPTTSRKLSVRELARELDITPFTAREKLRRHGVAKGEKRYEFTKSEFASLVKKFRAEPKEARPEENRKPRKKAA